MRTALFLSHTPISTGRFAVGSHHLARAMAGLGWKVFHVPAPMFAPYALASLLPGPVAGHRERGLLSFGLHHTRCDGATEIAAPGFVSNPMRLRLGPEHIIVRREATAIARLIERRTGHDNFDVVLVDKATMAPVAERLRHRFLVYRPTDNYTGFEGPRVRDFERRLVTSASLVAATSTTTLETLIGDTGLTPRSSVVFPNAIDQDFADRALALADSVSAFRLEAARPSCAYLGSTDERFDWGCIEALSNSSIATTIIGGGHGKQDPHPLRHVRLLGEMARLDALPVLARSTVGLLPLHDIPSNRSRSAMKVAEYLAVGMAVVVPDWMDVPAWFASGVVRYSGPADFAAAVQEAHRLSKDLRGGVWGPTWTEVAAQILERC